MPGPHDRARHIPGGPDGRRDAASRQRHVFTAFQSCPGVGLQGFLPGCPSTFRIGQQGNARESQWLGDDSWRLGLHVDRERKGLQILLPAASS